MRDVYLDPVTGDISLSAGQTRMTTPGVESFAQQLRIRLRRWKGEYPLNILEGMPYAVILGTKGTAARPGGPAQLASVVRQAISTSPGIASLDTYRCDVSADRHGVIQFASRTTDGGLIVNGVAAPATNPAGFIAAEFV